MADKWHLRGAVNQGVEGNAEHLLCSTRCGVFHIYLFDFCFPHQDYPSPTPSPEAGNPSRQTKGAAPVDDPLVDEYNYETINEEYFTPLPYEDINYNEEVDPQGELTENAVEAELPTSTVITYNETDVI